MDKTINTTEKGNELRDAVFSVVKTAQKLNYAVEKNVAGKNVDVYYEESDRLQRGVIKYGVECKHYGKALGRTDYDSIIATYISLLSSNAIDYLIIITDLPPTPGVLDTVENNRQVVHKTFDEFSSLIMDFSQYLTSVVSMYKNEGLCDYYVPIKDIEGNDIENTINKWVLTEDCSPIAILAGYGMGKTSFATMLASKFARRCLNGETSRIPIYLKLGDIFNEQGIEGLVCKYFASQYNVSGFTYPLFLEFNRLGRFLIILDGFDEMKHAMSFSAFRSNIREFNKLVVNQSKVVILGRPNAFTSENEKSSVLHGIKYIGDQEVKDAEMRDYREIEVGLFTGEQLNDFIPKFISYSADQAPINSYDFINKDFCDQRISELLDEKHRELISRPVHARMLTLIALATTEALSSFTTYHLYETFYERILEREDSRPARKKISKDERKEFITKLSWERWIKGGDRGFSFEDVETLNFNLKAPEAPRKDILRDLIIGSVIESKGDNFFYFAHRSFQEFLVSQHILSLEWGTNSISDVDRALGQNVIDFIEESGQKRQFIGHLLEQMCSFTGEITSSFYRFIRTETFKLDFDIGFSLIEPSSYDDCQSPWHALLAFSCPTTIGLRGFDSTLVNFYEFTTDSNIKLAIFIGTLIKALGMNSGVDKQAFLLIDLFHWQVFKIISKCKIHKGNIRDFAVENDLDRTLLTSFLKSASVEFTTKGEVSNVKLDLANLLTLLLDATRGNFYISNIEAVYNSTGNSSVKLPVLKIGELLSFRYPARNERDSEEVNQLNSQLRRDRKKIQQFWRANPTASTLVPVKVRAENAKKRSVLKLKNSRNSLESEY
ncbi:NACHT domain-containing NTPase [Microbulbifer sp. A4B17]|uniref:NACHT domain-containing protein n=1 Tax=Microbulbifer sp. A4B17 TaxID=359370 RepID=UPI001EDD25A5|nr:NACHT domain-containing protein [Microbulbifer sp. A4B17]